MEHNITFDSTFSDFILTQNEVMDLIQLFYRWDDATFLIKQDENERSFRGQHQMTMGNIHNITLVKKNIEKDFKTGLRIGCNHTAPTLKVAAAMVLVHELQHANQTKFHKQSETAFYRDHRYWDRACEREARAYVDEHLNEICAYFSVPPPMRRKQFGHGVGQEEVLAVADLLCECSDVTMEDIKEELRASKVLTPGNVKIVLDIMKSRGFESKTI